MIRLRRSHLLLLLCLALAACGGGLGTALPGRPSEADSRIEARKEGFTLRVLDESFRYGGSADFSLEVETTASETTVIVSGKAEGLRAAYLELEYDEAKLHATEALATDWPLAGSELLHLALLNEAGSAEGKAAAWLGAVTTGLDENVGASGSFELWRVVFKAGPAPSLRAASKVPTAEASRIPDLAVDTESGSLSFSYYNVGDYNQDGRIAVTDLTPIGIRFGDQVPENSPNSVEAVVDGTPDGRINVQDLTPIGLNFQARVDLFNVYKGTDIDYSVDNNGGALLLGAIPFSPEPGGTIQRLGDPGQVRLSYSAVFPELQVDEDAVVWVQPVATPSEGVVEAGIKSVPVVLEGGGTTGDKTPPSWDNIASPGILSVDAIDGMAHVTWGSASDTTSPPVTYRLYYNEGATVNFSADSFLEFADGTFETDITGLTNGQVYAFAVRAADSADPPNEDKNLRTIQATPLATESLPSMIDEDTSFTNPILLPEGDSTDVQNCSVLTFQNDVTIDGDLKAVDCDLHIVVMGDLVVNGKLTLQTSIADPSGTGQDAFGIKIEAHGNVTFGPDSEMENSGNFYLVDNSALFADPLSVVQDTDTDQNPELYPFNLMRETPSAPLGFKGGSSMGFTFNSGQSGQPVSRQASDAQFVWTLAGDWGQQPSAAPAVQRVVYSIYSQSAALNLDGWNLIGPAGRTPPMVSDCNAFGALGGDAYRLRIHSNEAISINDCSLSMSEGGQGASASAIVCCDAYAEGGKGGQPGRFRITSGTGLSFGPDQSILDPGKGGDGGDATAIAQDGQAGCDPETGCQANANGGDGADVFFGLAARGEIAGLENLQVLELRAGNGGTATSNGGNGGTTTCLCGGDGADGGFGVAVGGDGGGAVFGSLTGASGGGARSGDGGNATANGGDGTDGGDCPKLGEGGAGGHGGNATAAAGSAGLAEGEGVTLTQGAGGEAAATGGAGADGGTGCSSGSPGSGGEANATGENAVATEGPVGTEGEHSCPVIWRITLSSFLPPDEGPGPQVIPDGYSGDATLINLLDLEVAGTVPFVWNVPVPGGAVWDTDVFSSSDFFLMTNSSMDQNISVEFDFSQVDLLDGTALGLLGSSLAVRENHAVVNSELGAFVDLLSTPDLNTLFIEELDEVAYVPGGDPNIDMLDFDGLKPMSIYRIVCPPQWVFSCQGLTVTDP